MATIATLTVDLVAQTSKFNSNLAKSSKRTRNWGKETRAAVNVAGKAFAGMAATVAVALGGIYAHTAKAGDEVAKFSDKVGEAPERVMALHHAAELTGVSVETTNMALQRMVRRTSEAANGTGEAVGAIKELGLDAKRLAQLSPADQFHEIAGAMEGVTNQGDRVRLAMKLFDSEGVALVNTLGMGKAGLQGMEAEAEQLGLTMNRLELAKLEAANDAMTRARATTKGFTNALAVQMAPVVGGIANALADAAKEAGGFGNLAQRVVESGLRGFGKLADVGRGVKVVFLGIRQVVAELLNGIVQFYNTSVTIGGKLAEKLGFDTSAVRSVNQFADSMQSTTERLRNELADLAMQPMPSEAIEKWLAENAHRFEQAAQEVAERSRSRMGSGLAIPQVNSDQVQAETDKLINLQQQRFQRLHEQAMEAQGRTRELELERRERERAEMAANMERLREAGLLTAEIKTQFRQAEEDAELIHQQKLADIKEQEVQKEREAAEERHRIRQEEVQKQQEVARARWQIAEDVMSIGAAMVKEDSKAHRAMLAASKIAALMQSKIALQEAIAKANAVGFPANIPAIAQAVSIGAGAISQLEGIDASFDGGGFTGNGPRSGGLDGKGGFLAMMHPRETVVDHTKPGGGRAEVGTLRVTIINNGQPADAQVDMVSDDHLQVVLRAMDNKLRQDLGEGRGIWREAKNKYQWSTKGAIG